MSRWILGLMIFQFTLWEVNRETCPWQGLFYRSFLTLTTTSGKALHCNSLTVALYSKHLVLQVKNYFWFFVLKLSFILGLNYGFGDFFLFFYFFLITSKLFKAYKVCKSNCKTRYSFVLFFFFSRIWHTTYAITIGYKQSPCLLVFTCVILGKLLPSSFLYTSVNDPYPVCVNS